MTHDLVEKEVGYIYSSFSGIAEIRGLPHTFLHEVLVDEEENPQAIVIGFQEDFVEALLFNENFDVQKPLFRSKEVFSIPVSEDIIGRIIDGLGNPLDKKLRIKGKAFPIFRLAPPIIEREPVSVPLLTGIKAIDATLPIGRGQRELIIGDRKLGKTTIALDTILNQKEADPPVFCIYVLCGKEERELKDIIQLFQEYDTFSYTTIVAAPSSDSFASKYLAPFIGCTIGEYFRDQGKDALVVYDDLSKHAKTYRDISLLLGRAPGREAYPGDIFSLHAQLLERAANLSRKEQKRGGSLTALPIIETQEGDISSFIPTNLISITDGQIYLENGLFQRGFIPAINIGLSVSRVGSQAQPKPLREVTGGLRLSLAQHRELQKLVQLETRLSKEAQERVKRGDLILEVLKQEKHKTISWEKEVILFFAVENGYFDEVKKEKWKEIEGLFLNFIEANYQELMEKIKEEGLSARVKDEAKRAIINFKEGFLEK